MTSPLRLGFIALNDAAPIVAAEAVGHFAREGIAVDREVRLMVAPPARMTGLLADGVVEGFCVTEPWDTAAVEAGAGVIAVRSAQLWPRTPDKVFAVTEGWAAANGGRLQALLR